MNSNRAINRDVARTSAVALRVGAEQAGAFDDRAHVLILTQEDDLSLVACISSNALSSNAFTCVLQTVGDSADLHLAE